jgi:hypothetical protein
MNKILIILCLITINYLNATVNKAYLNIISNVEDTTIFLDGKKIGKTPIKQYEVMPNNPLYLKAVVDAAYYKRNIKTTIKVNNKTIPTFSLKFQKAMAKVFLVGDNAELYINDKFIKKLNDTNRVVTIESGKKIKIRLLDGDGEVNYIKDIKAKTLNTLKYELIRIPKEIRIYTSTINDLMWEDTKDATNKDINWEKAYDHCANLKFANYDDFRLPSIDELSVLHDYKDKIYNGFGGKFYWSSSTFKDEHKVWDYSVVKNFENGMNQKSIKEFEQGRVRCVRDIATKEKEINENK